MIEWQPIRVVTPPTGQLTLAACRAYIRLPANLRSDEERSQDALLDTFRAAIPAEYERRLNRALWRQTRAVTAVARYDLIHDVLLEPHDSTTLTVRTGTAPDALAALAADEVVDTGTRIYFDTPLEARRRLFVEFTYEAGWATLPVQIHDAMLDEVQRRYERHTQRTNDAGEVVVTVRAPSGKLPVAASSFRVGHDPVPLISSG